MDKAQTLEQLFANLLIAIESPIAHAYGYAELAQHEMDQSDADIEQVRGDVARIMVNLSRVLVDIEDFSQEYYKLK